MAVLAIAGTVEVKTQEAAGYSGFVGKFCDRGLVGKTMPITPACPFEGRQYSGVAVGLLRIHAVMKTARQMILGKKRTFHLPNIPSRQLSPRKRTRETLP
ncbi:MAG TPA: hypothetical protein VK638_36100, partial [Edaphobacter sp.]|nr:hypothetical protein [Edaphobacter sp.]